MPCHCFPLLCHLSKHCTLCADLPTYAAALIIDLLCNCSCLYTAADSQIMSALFPVQPHSESNLHSQSNLTPSPTSIPSPTSLPVQPHPQSNLIPSPTSVERWGVWWLQHDSHRSAHGIRVWLILFGIYQILLLTLFLSCFWSMALKVSEYSRYHWTGVTIKRGYRAVQFVFKCDCEMECTSQ